MDMKDETLLLLQRITEQYGSVNRLAKELGIPQSTLNSILNHGIETARFETAAAIYAKLGIPLPMVNRSLAAQDLPAAQKFKELDDHGVRSMDAVIQALLYEQQKRETSFPNN